MEQQPTLIPEQVRSPSCSDSFSSRLLGQILQLSLVKYPLKLLQKASIWIGLVLPVDTLRSKFYPPSQSPARPGLLARKRRGKLVRLLLSVTPSSIQNLLGYLPANWGHSNMSKEVREALVNPSSKASKRKRDDVAMEKHESWFVVLERDLPEDDSEDLTYEPIELESDSDEYQSHNDTDLELEEQGEITMLEPLGAQGSALPPEPGAEDPAVASSGEDAPDVASSEDAPDVASSEDAPDVASSDAWQPGASGSSEQDTDTACDTSSSQDGEN